MKRILIFILFIAFGSSIVSQDNWKIYPSSPDSSRVDSNRIDTTKHQLNYSLNNGEITIFKDVRIDSIQKELSEKPTIMGWTVQILVSQQKEELKNTRIKFLKAFPDQQLFDEYKTPNTYLYAGRFYDKVSAYYFKNELTVLFENTRVVKKLIELPILPEKKAQPDHEDSPENNTQKIE